MIDSHCHLDHIPLIDNLKDIVERSKEAGLEKLLTISTTLDSFETILKIIDKDPIIYGTFGIHPHEADKEKVLKNDIINKIKLNKKIIGVGESGLDFFYNHSNKKNQIESFKDHIEASIELKVPIIVHSRNAEIDTFEILNSYKSQNPKILMHCFTGSHDLFKKLMDLNAFFSASGIITFKNSTDLQKTFSSIPIENLLVETDSPYLAPVPMRGKKNEPSFVKYTLQKLAELKKVGRSKMETETTKNFNRLFSFIND
tara:strand:+ start:1154 stop:1924 length:771 start_codon:yes stop_codon:yes gene_type:complete